jgi:GntR family transcriptional regulator, galactonate operon transcriptional repressor
MKETRRRGELLHAQVTRELALGILKGEIRNAEPGFSTEADFSSLFNVSRSVLRESIKVLAAKGLVEVRPRIGVRVCPRSQWNLIDPDLLAWQCEAGADDALARDICEIRLVLEPSAAEMAALRGSKQEIAAIESAYHRMEEIGVNNSAMLDADMQFHYNILTASHNQLLMQIGNTIRTGFLHALKLGTRALHSMDLTLPMHKRISQAILKHDAQAARAEMEQLIRQTVRDCQQALQLGRRPKSRVRSR